MIHDIQLALRLERARLREMKRVQFAYVQYTKFKFKLRLKYKTET